MKEKPKSDLRLILVGEQWTGKSWAGNTILGRTVFEVNSDTEHAVHSFGVIEGRNVTLVDTPGWDAGCPPDVPLRMLKQRYSSPSMPCPGFHILLLTINISQDQLWNQKVAQRLSNTLKFFSEDMWKHTMLLFTNAKHLNSTELQEYLEGSGQPFKSLVEKCGGKDRCHVLTNHNQISELLEKIGKIVQENNGQTLQLVTRKEVDEHEMGNRQWMERHSKMEELIGRESCFNFQDYIFKSLRPLESYPPNMTMQWELPEESRMSVLQFISQMSHTVDMHDVEETESTSGLCSERFVEGHRDFFPGVAMTCILQISVCWRKTKHQTHWISFTLCGNYQTLNLLSIIILCHIVIHLIYNTYEVSEETGEQNMSKKVPGSAEHQQEPSIGKQGMFYPLLGQIGSYMRMSLDEEVTQCNEMKDDEEIIQEYVRGEDEVLSKQIQKHEEEKKIAQQNWEGEDLMKHIHNCEEEEGEENQSQQITGDNEKIPYQSKWDDNQKILRNDYNNILKQRQRAKDDCTIQHGIKLNEKQIPQNNKSNYEVTDPQSNIDEDAKILKLKRMNDDLSHKHSRGRYNSNVYDGKIRDISKCNIKHKEEEPQPNEMGYMEEIPQPRKKGYMNKIFQPNKNGIKKEIPQICKNGIKEGIPQLNKKGYKEDIPQPRKKGYVDKILQLSKNGIKEGIPQLSKNGIKEGIPQLSKNGYKEGIPQLSKKGIKEGIPQLSKNGYKEGIPQLTKNGIKEGIHQLSKKGIKEGIPKLSKNGYKEGIPQLTKNGIKEGIPQLSKNGIKKEIHQLSKKGIKKEIHQLSKKGIKKEIPQLSKNGIKKEIHQLSKKGIKKEIHQLSKKGIKEGIPKLSKNGYKEGIPQLSKNGYKEGIPQLSKKGYKEGIPQLSKKDYKEDIPQPRKKGYMDRILQPNKKGIKEGIPQLGKKGYKENIPQHDTRGYNEDIPQYNRGDHKKSLAQYNMKEVPQINGTVYEEFEAQFNSMVDDKTIPQHIRDKSEEIPKHSRKTDNEHKRKGGDGGGYQHCESGHNHENIKIGVDDDIPQHNMSEDGKEIPQQVRTRDSDCLPQHSRKRHAKKIPHHTTERQDGEVNFTGSSRIWRSQSMDLHDISLNVGEEDMRQHGGFRKIRRSKSLERFDAFNLEGREDS